MESMLSSSSPYITLVRAQDLIGFDNLLVGRLPELLIIISARMEPRLAMLNQRKVTVHAGLRTSPACSSSSLTVNGHTEIVQCITEHTLVNDQVQSLLQLPSVSLPQQRRHLLTKEDIAALLGGTTATKKFWIAEIQSALAEAALLRGTWNTREERSESANMEISFSYHRYYLVLLHQ